MILVFFTFFSFSFSAPSSEIEALKDIYFSLGGESWKNSDSWLNGDPCTNKWYKVACTDDHITSLQLNDNNLVGTIPNSISNLTDLKFLALEWNGNIKGPLPKDIGKMKNLQVLTMPNNQIDGALPYEIGMLSNLMILHLGGNKITSIPESIKNLESCTSFAVEGNMINSLIPDEGPPLIMKHQFGSDCNLSGNKNIPCPLPKWAESICHATCT